MADRFDVSPQTTSYGAVTGLRGLQAELLRRAQFEEAQRLEQQRAEQLAFERQRLAAADKRQAELDAINKQVALENLASNVESRKSAAAAREAATQEREAKLMTAQMKPGAISTEQYNRAKANPLMAGLVLAQPKVEMPVGAGLPAALGGQDVAPPTLSTQNEQYIGTPEQQETVKRQQFIDDFVAGKLDDQFGDADPQQLAAAKLVVRSSGGAGLATALASLMKPPKTAAETKAQRDAELETILAKPEAEWTPEERAKVAGRRGLNKLTAEPAATRQSITIEHSDDAAAKRYANQAKTSFRASIDRENASLLKDLERADRAKAMLKRENFVADAIAAPEVLQIVAGGMGSGLRMTDAELNRINQAQTMLEQLRGRAAKLPGASLLGIEGKTIQATMRKQMQDIIDMVEKARVRHHKLQEETLRKIGSADSPEDVDQIKSDYWERRREATSLAPEAPTVAPAGSRFNVTIK